MYWIVALLKTIAYKKSNYEIMKNVWKMLSLFELYFACNFS